MACVPGTGPAVKDLCYNDIIELKQRNEIILIDVRDVSEIEETGKLPGSVHIPRKFPHTICRHYRRQHHFYCSNMTSRVIHWSYTKSVAPN
jgi:hypothetical protein